MEQFLLFFETMPTWMKALWVFFTLAFFWILEGYYSLVVLKYKKWKHAKVNLILLLFVMLINAVFGIVTVGVFDWLATSKFGLLHLFNAPVWVELLISIAILDLIAQYFVHFCLHKVPAMWRLHLVHHSDKNVDADFHPYKFDFDKEAVFSVDENSIINFILGEKKEDVSKKKITTLANKDAEFFEQLDKDILNLKNATLEEQQRTDIINRLKEALVEKEKETNNKLQIDIDLRKSKYEDEKLVAEYRFARYKQDFQLDAIYANHTDIVTELYQKKYHYPESRKQEISNLLAGTGERLTPEEITRMLRGSYIEREKILQRPLSKLIKDISDELDLI